MEEPKDEKRKRPIYVDYLAVVLLVGLAFIIGFKINKTDQTQVNAIEQRLRDINSESEYRIDSLLKSTLNDFRVGQTLTV